MDVHNAHLYIELTSHSFPDSFHPSFLFYLFLSWLDSMLREWWGRRLVHIRDFYRGAQQFAERWTKKMRWKESLPRTRGSRPALRKHNPKWRVCQSVLPVNDCASESTPTEKAGTQGCSNVVILKQGEHWVFVLILDPSVISVICNWYGITDTDMSALIIHRTGGFPLLGRDSLMLSLQQLGRVDKLQKVHKLNKVEQCGCHESWNSRSGQSFQGGPLPTIFF